VSPKELDREIEATMARFGKDEVIEEQTFLNAFIDNSYWKEAGPLVVKELIYLDCLQSHYFSREDLLNDADFDELKQMLIWEGSSAATLFSKEARFISAVAANKRGVPLISDAEYDSLKRELQQERSWVVARMQDPLEKLGLQTYLGYLHRIMDTQ
jgi:hypothetical protein